MTKTSKIKLTRQQRLLLNNLNKATNVPPTHRPPQPLTTTIPYHKLISYVPPSLLPLPVPEECEPPPPGTEELQLPPAKIIKTEGLFDEISYVYDLSQTGEVITGPGARSNTIAGILGGKLPKLSSYGADAVTIAKDYAMEQSIQMVLKKETIDDQQQPNLDFQHASSANQWSTYVPPPENYMEEEENWDDDNYATYKPSNHILNKIIIRTPPPKMTKAQKRRWKELERIRLDRLSETEEVEMSFQSKLPYPELMLWMN